MLVTGSNFWGAEHSKPCPQLAAHINKTWTKNQGPGTVFQKQNLKSRNTSAILDCHHYTNF